MKENTTNSQQEISLDPTGRLVENAEEIAEASKTAEKHIFCVTYEAVEKAALLSEMEALGVEILSQSDLDSTVIVRICMAQLAAIKSLNCIEKVETVAEDEAVSSVETYMLQSTDNDGMMSTQALASEPMATYSSCCPNTIGTAVTLPLEIWRTGCICCPCAETWYRFTPSVTGYHTIHTEGILDTMGSLYDANGCQLSSNDDGGADLNFKIVYYLTANRTYYVRVKAYSNNTGTFRIAVQNKVYVESVTVNNANVILNKSNSVTLSAVVSPANATNKAIQWSSANTSVATVDATTGTVITVGSGTTQVYAYAQDGSGAEGMCTITVLQKDLIDIAENELGNNSVKYTNAFNYPATTPWCAIFASWCATQCDFISHGVLPQFISCTTGVNTWFKPNGLYRTREEYVPKRGDLIFFNWDGLSWGTPWNETSDNFQHVGIVEKVEDGRVYTIEGNRGSLPSDQTVVGRYNTTLKNKYIRGYCIPNYSAYGS